MGSFSDRANPRVFLPVGLILAASMMLIMGRFEWATSSVTIMFVLLFLCGWFQGMGWPPCGYPQKFEHADAYKEGLPVLQALSQCEEQV